MRFGVFGLGTLGGDTVRSGTLGGETVVGVTLGGEVEIAGGLFVWDWKMSASFRMACSCSWPSVAKGAAGEGLARASRRARAASVAASEEDVFGTGQSWGKDSTVLAMRSARVFEM
jgi:hypothetical protein